MGDSILLLDIERGSATTLSSRLAGIGLRTENARDAESALLAIEHHAADAIIYAVAQDEAESTCHALRGCMGGPLAGVVGHTDEQTVVRLLRAGADAVLPRGASQDVLGARLRALSRRRNGAGPTRRHEACAVGNLKVDPHSHVAERDGEPISLSPTEFRLLAALASRGGEVVSRDELLAEVWGGRHSAHVESLRHYIRYLRQKIEDDPTRPSIILNDRGVGYRLATESRVAAGRVAADAASG